MNSDATIVFKNILSNIKSDPRESLTYEDMVDDFELLDGLLEKRFKNFIKRILYEYNGQLRSSYSDLANVYNIYQVYLGDRLGRKRGRDWE